MPVDNLLTVNWISVQAGPVANYWSFLSVWQIVAENNNNRVARQHVL